jgi:hypothetical protein
MCVERLLPPRRDRPVHFTLPELNSAADAGKASAAITLAVSSGDLTLAEAGELSKLVESYIKVFEATEVERRIQALDAP